MQVERYEYLHSVTNRSSIYSSYNPFFYPRPAREELASSCSLDKVSLNSSNADSRLLVFMSSTVQFPYIHSSFLEVLITLRGPNAVQRGLLRLEPYIYVDFHLLITAQVVGMMHLTPTKIAVFQISLSFQHVSVVHTSSRICHTVSRESFHSLRVEESP
jgi:hypothetical protein